MPSLLIYNDLSKNETSIINKILNNNDDFKNYCIQLFNFINKKYLLSNTNNTSNNISNNTSKSIKTTETKLSYKLTDNDSIFIIHKEDNIIRSGWIYNSHDTIVTPIYEFKTLQINNELTDYLNKQEETLKDLLLLNNSLEQTINYFFDKSPTEKLQYKKTTFNFTDGLVEQLSYETDRIHLEEIQSQSSYQNNPDSDCDLSDDDNVCNTLLPISSIYNNSDYNPNPNSNLYNNLNDNTDKKLLLFSENYNYLDKTHTIHQQNQQTHNPNLYESIQKCVQPVLLPINTENDSSLESYMNNYSYNYNFNYQPNYKINSKQQLICNNVYENDNKIYTISQPSQIYSPFINKINYTLHGQCTTEKNKNNIYNQLDQLDNKEINFIDELKEKLHQKFKNTYP